jgi:aryl-alcohol dehydrogenase-like predicted oxidoreductase
MQSQRFGTTDLVVSAVGFGCARIGGVFAGSSQKGTLRLLRRAVDEGISFFDTADMYTQGESERALGEALGHSRGRVVIATKFGYLLPRQKRFVSRLKPALIPLVRRLGLKRRHIRTGGLGTVWQQDFSPTYIVGAVEASLKRLNTDYVDLFQLHSPPRETLERGDFVEPLERLREQGKIRYWGVACEEPEDVPVCLPYSSLASVQIAVNALEQSAFDSAIPQASARGVGIIGRQVFASGLLTRPVEDIEPQQLHADHERAQEKRQQLRRYAAIVERSGRSRAEMALQFALGTREVSVVLLGISHMEQLDASLRALHAPGLSQEERNSLIAARREAWSGRGT